MKQFILTHKVLCIVLACVLLAGATCAIVLPIALKHEHAYATEWSNDATNHWHAATCEHTDLKKDEAAHTFGEWTTKTEAGYGVNEVQKRTCTVCEKQEERTVDNSALPAKDNDITVKTIDFTYNTEAQPIDSLVEAGNKEGMVIEYEGRSYTSYDKTTTAPTNVGLYKYTITIPATAEWNAAEFSGEFQIKRYFITEVEGHHKKEYNGVAVIDLKLDLTKYEGISSIQIYFESKNVGAAMTRVLINGIGRNNYDVNEDNVTAEIIPKKLSGLNIHIKESEIDKEEQEIFRFSTKIDGVKIDGEIEKIDVLLEFFCEDLDGNDDLLLTTERPEAAGTEKCKIIINNANYELADSNIGRLYLDRETAES